MAIRSKDPDNAQLANDKAEDNKANANAAVSVPDLQVVVFDNAEAIQLLIQDNQSLRAELRRLFILQGRT